MRVQCLHSTVIIIFAFFATCPHLVLSAPALKVKSMDDSGLDNLRRSIARLREAVGNSIAESTLHLPSAQRHFHRDSIYTARNRAESSETAILNIKADIRRMDAESDHFDEDISEENSHRIINDERILPSEPRRRHFRQRKRRKGCNPSRHGHQQMLCPSRSPYNYDVCITSEQLCDDIPDCPGGEDENATNCLFYKSVKEQLKHIYNTVLLLADHATGQNSHHEL